MEKKMAKIFYIFSTLLAFGVFLTLILLNFLGFLSKEAIERIDYIGLILGLVVYIADTSGFLEKHKWSLTPARAVTFITITLSLMLHLLTPEYMIEHFSVYVLVAVVLLLICLAALAYKFFCWAERKGKETLQQQSGSQNQPTTEPDDRRE